MHPPASLTRGAYARPIIVALAFALATIGTITALIPAARAAQNSNVSVSVQPLVLSDWNGNDIPNMPAQVEKPVRMRFAWDASRANPQPGESFSISLPAEYRFVEGGRRDPLVLGDGTTVGECVTASGALTCTFNQAITSADELKGSGTQLLMAQKVTQTNTSTFNLNGTDASIPNPNNQPIMPIDWVEKDLGKYANSLKRDSSALTWHIQFSGTTIANHLQVEDGTVSTVMFQDVSGGGQALDTDLANWYVRVNPASAGGGPDGYFDLVDANGTVKNSDHGSFTLTPTISADGTTASITLTRTDGTFSPDANYEIVYKSLATGGGIIPGVKYTNTATLQGGKNTQVAANVTYKDPISYDVQLTQGYGSFGIKKYATGTQQAKVNESTKVSVNVSYTLPNGTTEADFPGWTNKPPSNPYTVTIPVGQQQDASTLYQFPEGTTVTLTEDTSGATLPSDLTWGKKSFIVDGNQTPDTATFTIGESVTGVGLYNTVDLKKSGFTIAKTVDGDTAASAPSSFIFTYQCTLDGASVLDSSVDVAVGTPATVSDVPVGASCTVTESAPAEVPDTTTSVALTADGTAGTNSSVTFTVVADRSVDVQAVNTYQPVPKPEPTPEPTPSPEPSPDPTVDPTPVPEPTPGPSDGPSDPSGPGTSSPTPATGGSDGGLAKTGPATTWMLSLAAAALLPGAILMVRRRHVK